MWTFGRKIAAGFIVSSTLLLLIGLVAHRSISTMLQAGHAVAHTHAVIDLIKSLANDLVHVEAGQRGFALTGDEALLTPYNRATADFAADLKDLRARVTDNPAQTRRLDTAEQLVDAKLADLRRAIDSRRQGGLDAAVRLAQQGEGRRSMDDVMRLLEQMEQEERQLLRQRAEEADSAARDARVAILGGTAVSLVFVCLAGVFITRSLTTQIASAVRHVQQSSTELQSAANQQAAGARESSTSMTEITTTISELLATSRQIADSAQRVSSVAEQTAGAARGGETTVDAAAESIAAIRQQVDQVVAHMLELGKKSQQIGTVLDIVSELAEQTNILAINATIEASGAGEAGRRFGVVADEIRKLADRVTGSTKEIRTLIDDVRSAVNTTVMATETGSKAVETGARQFGEVASAFKRIASMVITTTEAAREIGLSTKQQATAVEQVNLAIANTAQATKETEASSGQTYQTASQLAGLSRDLLRLVQPQTA